MQLFELKYWLVRERMRIAGASRDKLNRLYIISGASEGANVK